MFNIPQYFLFLILTFDVIDSSQGVEISSNFFQKADLCDLSDRLYWGCSFTLTTPSRIVCTFRCESNRLCIGVSQDDLGVCYHHKECPTVSGCTIQNTKHHFRTKHCRHGYWDIPTQRCICVDGFYGEKCSQCHGTCRDLVGAGYADGPHRVFLDPNYDCQRPFLTFCHILGGGGFVTAELMANQGVESFNRSWPEYVIGFQNALDDYWAGLYAFHMLSNNGCSQSVFVFGLHGVAANMHHIYGGFSVSDGSNGYRFTFDFDNAGGGLGDGNYYGDCMGPLKNVPFSTWDNDNDGDVGENCANRAGSGWWYSGCARSCNELGYGFQRWGSGIPSYQRMSLVGADLSYYTSYHPVFHMYVEC